MYKVWYSTESFADYIIDKTNLSQRPFAKAKLFESDANNARNFHSLPDHIKKILYLDAPDLIVEINAEPLFSIEVTSEAGTGHNAFQRFARLAASVENDVPAFYIYPEAVIVHRQNSPSRWDRINPLVFKAMKEMMNIYDIPALLYYFPSDFRLSPDPSNAPHLATKGLMYDTNLSYLSCPDSADNEMQELFNAVNEIITTTEQKGIIAGRKHLLRNMVIRQRKQFMSNEYVSKGGNINMSPITSTQTFNTDYLLNYLSSFESNDYKIGSLLRSRDQTVAYTINASFRGDPYPGALSAIDYVLCREGKTFEDRRHNLILVWGQMTLDDNKQSFSICGTKGKIKDFVNTVKNSETKNLLSRNYNQLRNYEIPRYYMQIRHGSTYSKVKHIRVYSYFADAIIFPDGAVWRDG